MSRRRSEWPEPWVRLRWSPHDVTRIERLDRARLTDFDRRFVNDMKVLDVATLQQVAYLRRLARKYRADPDRAISERDRYIDLE